MQCRVPRRDRHRGLYVPDRARTAAGSGRSPGPREPDARDHRTGVSPPVRGQLQPRVPGRGRGHPLGGAAVGRHDPRRAPATCPRAHADRDRGRDRFRPRGSLLRILPDPDGLWGDCLRGGGRGRRHASARHPGVSPSARHPGSADRADPGCRDRPPHLHPRRRGRALDGARRVRRRLRGPRRARGQGLPNRRSRRSDGDPSRPGVPERGQRGRASRSRRTRDRGRRRKHGHGLRPLRSPPGRRRHGAVPAHPARDAGHPTGSSGSEAGGGGVRVPGRSDRRRAGKRRL